MTNTPIPEEAGGYSAAMPLPSWAADAVAKLSDTDRLVLIETSMMLGDAPPTVEPVLAVAHWSTTSGPAGRAEFHIIAVLTDTNIQNMIYGDREHDRIYPFSTEKEGGDAMGD